MAALTIDTVVTSNTTFNLETTNTPTDFAVYRFGVSAGAVDIRKTGGGSLISSAALYGGGSWAGYSGDARQVDWSGGTPTATGPIDEAIFTEGGGGGGGVNTGFEITFTLNGTNSHEAYVLFGSYSAAHRITAILSDASVGDQTSTAFVGASGASRSGYVKVTAAAASSGQTLKIRVEKITVYSGYGNVTLQAASLKDLGSGGGGIALTGTEGTGAVGTVSPWSSKALTNNVGTGAVGTVTQSRTVALTNNAATGDVGAVGPSVTIALSGVEGTGAVGNVTAGADVTLALTGVEGAGSVGDVATSFDAALTNVNATGESGTVSPSSDAELTNVVGTTSVGDVSPSTSIESTGVEATGDVGSVSASSDISITLTGVESAGNAGDVSPSIQAPLSGEDAPGEVGSVEVAGSPDVTVALTGVEGTGDIGDVAPSSSLSISGNEGTASVGEIYAALLKSISGNSASGSPGDIGPSSSLDLTGSEGTGEVGDVATAGDVTVAITGVEATGEAGTVAVAGEYEEIALAVWNFVLPNGKTAQETVMEVWESVSNPIEGPYNAPDLLKIMAAVLAGKTTITPETAGNAIVEFRAVDDSEVRVSADMEGSERVDVTIIT